ncbi:MAG: leucine-rich repeat protein [Spirochaetaceae bacterium]|nr:leucine-rich repeat protein [Spirochaetaceae bacterium]MBQ7366721.1 leucine-rich repeat protein [Spirochaetaceae bacterium]
MKKQGKKWMLVALALLAVVTVALPLVGCKNDTVAEQTGDGTGSGSGNQGSGDPEQPVTYTVSFITNGGGPIDSQTIVSGQTATKPADPTLENNVFGGWYSDEELTSEYDFTTPVTGSFPLYAKWVKRIEVIADDVYYSEIAGLTGDGSYILVAIGNWSSDDLSAIKTALNEKPTAKVNLDLSKATGLTSIGESAFDECRGLTSISIPEGVKSIGGGAFSGCSGLTSISIPSSVTSIGERAFRECSGLTSISIPEGVTSIGERAFNGCSNLATVTFGEGSLLTTIGISAFSGCSGLTSISIPSSVEIIGAGAFQGCSGLTSISIPEGVTTIGARAFGGCSSLNISVNENNTKYSSVNGMLLDKEKTTLIAYPSAKETVTNVPTSVTTIGNDAFYGCKSLTSISIPSSVTSIGEAAFSGCSSLTSITIPSEGVKSIGNGAFDGCKSLTSISIPSSVTSIGETAFFGCSSLTSITIPSEGIKSIGNAAFSGCSGLTTVTMKATTPPELGGSVFNGTAGNLQILVPSGFVDTYKEKWSDYKGKIKAIPDQTS